MTIQAMLWSNVNQTIQRIYLGEGYVECRHVGARGNSYAESVQYSSTTSADVLSAFAQRLGVPNEVSQKLFERFSEETIGTGRDSKKELKRKRSTPFVVEVGHV